MYKMTVTWKCTFYISILLLKIGLSVGFPPTGVTGTYALTKHHTEITKNPMREAVGDFLVTTNRYRGPNIASFSIPRAYFANDTDRWERYVQREGDIIKVITQHEQSNQAHIHCNAEQIDLAHAYIQRLRRQIKEIASESYPDLSLIRENIGKCLYTIQAFYSTTNWVEMNGGKPYRNFGVPGKALMTIADTNVDTCRDCSVSRANPNGCRHNLLVTDMLTSGYKTGQDVQPPYKTNTDVTRGKCGFGGISDTENGQRTAFGGINKDSRDPANSPHHFLHNDAFLAARTATYQFIIDAESGIINDMTDDVFANVFSLVRKSSYGFAIDVTGSMTPYINIVTLKCREIVENVTGTENEPSNYVLTTFSDPEYLTKHVLTTENGYLMTDTIDNLTVTGGGDCAEYALSGLKACIDLCDENSNIFLFTDASAKDESRRQEIENSAASKNIKLWPVLTGTCNKRKKRQIDRFKRQTGSGVFYEIAAATGGEVFRISGSEIPKVMDKIISTTFSSSTAIIDVITNHTAESDITFPIDNMLNSLTVEITGADSTSEVNLSSEGSSVGQYSFESPDKVVVKELNPVPGLYGLTKSGHNVWEVKITAQTSVDFEYDIFEEFSYGYLSSLTGNPIQGRTYRIFATVYELPANASVFGLILTNNHQEKTYYDILKIDSDFESIFVATVNFTSQYYRISIHGDDEEQKAWIRTSPKLVNVVTVRLAVSSVPDLYSGLSANISYTLENLGSEADIFKVSITDNRGVYENSTLESERLFNIPNGEWADIQFEIEGSGEYHSVTYYISVQKHGMDTILQQDKQTLYISSEVPPRCVINSLYWDCTSGLVNDSCSLVDWNGQATIEFSTRLHSIKGTYGLQIDYNSLETSPVIISVNGDCCMTSAYITVIDQNSNFARCHFYIGAPVSGDEWKPSLSTAEKIAIGVVAAIALASLVVLVLIAVGMQRWVIKPKLVAAKIADVNVRAVKDFPLQNEKSSKTRFHEDFSSLKKF